MADWYHLHLTFSPPIAEAKVKALGKIIDDYDFPRTAIGPTGTIVESSRQGIGFTGSRKGETWVSWRSPLVDEKELIEALETLGISGHGWFLRSYGDDDFRDIDDEDRFVFGSGQVEMRARIDLAKRRRAARHEQYEAEKAVLAAARVGPDDLPAAMAAAVARLIAADAACSEVPRA